MTISVLYFAQVAEKIGINKEDFDLKDGVTSLELIEILNEKYPQLKALKFKVAINQVLIQEKQKLRNGDEVALLPPFAGG